MPIKRAYPVRILPSGLSDAFDSTEAFSGAATALTNLIFDPANPECVVSRPGVGSAVLTATQISTQIGSGSATFISHHVGVGTVVYGWVSMSGGTFNGKDVPFAYDFATSSFVAITGLAAANLPTSPATSGAWTPPTIAVIGDYAIFTHPGFSGVGIHFFGAVKISTSAWTVQNLATNPLPGIPIAVANYNNRAYFAVGNASYYSDSLNPLTATNAGQVVTHGDNTAITAYVGLPVQTTSAGVVGQLVVFKPSQIWYVTGDAAVSSNPLSTNYLSLTMGSTFPRTVCQTPEGIFFIGTDGPMLVDVFGSVRAITHDQKRHVADVRLPFIYAITPSRAAGAFAQNVYRVCLQTIVQGASVTNDYWFDRNRKRWNGPHTFTYDCASQFGSYFLLSSAARGANLYASTPTQVPASVFNDVGTALSVRWTTSDFPKTMHMNEVQIIESTLEIAAGGTPVNYTCAMTDDERNIIASAIVSTNASGLLWGSGALWGSGGTWSNALIAPSQFVIPWPVPLVADKFIFDVQASSAASLMLGAYFNRYQDCGYVSSG